MTRPTYAELEDRWKRARANENAAYRKEKKRKRGRVAETAATLEAMYFATGDEACKLAFQAMKGLGYIEVGDNGAVKSVGGAWKFRPLHDKNAEAVYLASVENLVRQDVELRHAAAVVAVTYFVPGKTFDAVVAKLEKAYRAHLKARPAA